MKTYLILFLILLSQTTFGRGYSSISQAGLREGDWLKINYTTHFPTRQQPEVSDPWRAENVLRAELQGKVVRQSGNKLQIAFSLNHLYFHSERGENNAFAYYDSYYSADSLPVKNPIFTLDIQTVKEGNPKITYQLKDSLLFFPCELIPMGIKNIPGSPSISMNIPFPYQEMIEQAIIPTLLGHSVNSDRVICQLQQTSLGQPANTHIVYKPIAPLKGIDQFFTINSTTYTLLKQPDSSYRTSFFLSHPGTTLIGGELILLPGDSLIIRQTAQGDRIFEGRGAVNNRANQQLEKQYDALYFDHSFYFGLPDTADYLQKLRFGRQVYADCLKQYGEEMDPYWKKSVELSSKYWEATVRIKANWAFNRKAAHATMSPELAEIYKTPWHLELFKQISPFTDHLYHPDRYDDFLNAFFQYKVQQLTEDNLTNKFWWESDASTYYLQKQIFSGYPQTLRLAENLKEMMHKRHLDKTQREYEDFLHLCKDPLLKEEMEKRWRNYQRIEPGANIKDVGLYVGMLPLKKKADGYILFSESYLFGDPEEFAVDTQIDSILSELNIKDKTKLCYFRPLNRQGSIPKSFKNSRNYTFIDEKVLLEDCRKLNISPDALILMRNDGTILTREITKTQSGMEQLKAALEEAIHHPKGDKKYSKSEVYSFLITFTLAFIVLFAIVFSVVFIRVKRMRLMKKFTELKLQAIRSQMNPHFLFNALGSIQALILQGKNETANRYLIGFSKLLRTVLANSEKQLVPLSDEITLLNLYLQLEQLRCPFEYRFIIEDSVSPDTEEIPGMLLQPLVENAVIHGIVPQGKGHIDIHIYKQAHILYCEINDDGPGLQNNAVRNDNHKHFGLQGIEERLKLLHNTYPSIGVTVENRPEKEKQSGCRAIVSIPV